MPLLITGRIWKPSLELLANKSIEDADAKELASSPSLVVDKRRYDSVVQNLVAAAIKKRVVESL